MTGEKDRFTTHEKMWKLDDKTLSTPAHDELVLNATPSFILSRLPDILKEISDPVHWKWPFDTGGITDKLAEYRACRKFEDMHNRPPKTHHTDYTRNYYDRRSESSVSSEDKEQYKSDNEELLKMIQTEIDNSLITAKDSLKYLDSLKTFDFSTICKCSYEVPITSRNQFIIGYWDIILTVEKPIIFQCEKYKYEIQYSGGFPPTVIYIEAKPFIDSFGSVIRQIKTYVEYLQKTNYNTNIETKIVCLLSPDVRFKEAFESQGIRVISP